MDANKDGKATLEELQAFMRKSYYSSEEDTKDLQNDEGKPATPEDITKMIETDATELLTELDKDKSGDLNLEEVVAQYKDMEGDPDMDGGEEDASPEGMDEGPEPTD